MKKLKLFFAACALLLGVSNASAQTWTASEPADGEFYLYNVGADKYLNTGNSWGSHAALSTEGFIVTLADASEGKYTIATPKYNGSNHWFNNNGYVDSAIDNWYFEPVEGEPKTYKLKNANGSYAYATIGKCNVMLGADTGDKNFYWKLVTETNLNAATPNWAAATATNPVDATFLIKNPCFDLNNGNWDVAPARGGNLGTNGGEASWNETNPCAEHFNKNYETYQDVTGLENGVYALSVQGFYREGGYVDAAAKHVAGTESLNAILCANAAEQPLMSIFEEAGKASGGKTATAAGIDGAFPDNMAAASYFFSAGLYWNTVYVKVTDGTLKIGIKKSTAVGSDWTIFDNFRLQYFGDCTIEEAMFGNLVTSLASIVGEAQDFIDSDPALSSQQIAALQAIVNANDNDDHAFNTVEQYENAISNITNALSTYKTMIAPYAEFNALKAGANNLLLVESDKPAAKVDLESAISTQSEAADAAATLDEVEAAISALKSAILTYVGAATPTAGNKFDLTFLLTNPDLSVFTANGPQAGWYTDQKFQSQASQVMMNNQSVANSEDPSKYAMYEYWSSSSCATSGYTVYTKITLPEGTYKMDALCMTGWGYQASSPEGARNITFSAGDVDGTSIVTSTLESATLDFVQATEGEVKIGLKAHEGNTCNWMGIGYVELYKVPAKPYTVSENDAWDYNQSGAGDVTLNRTIKVGYNTLVLPFSMTQKEVEATFGEGSVVYELNSFENEVIGFQTTSGMLPNTPYILKATEEGTSYDIKGRTIVAGTANPTATVGAVSLIGSYDDEFIVPNNGDNYIVSGGKLYLVDSKVTIAGTRAYFNVVGNQAREISFDGVLTGIATVEKGELKKVFTGDIFDLTGRKVKNPSNGIFVVEGKKVVF